MISNKKEVYLDNGEGSMCLAEIFVERDVLSIVLAEEKRYDLTFDSAFDLADALMIIANEGYERE